MLPVHRSLLKEKHLCPSHLQSQQPAVAVSVWLAAAAGLVVADEWEWSDAAGVSDSQNLPYRGGRVG